MKYQAQFERKNTEVSLQFYPAFLKMKSIVRNFALLAGAVGAVSGAAVPRRQLKARGDTPANPYDPNTSEYCTWWVDYNEVIPCSQLLENNFATLEDFRRWV